MALEIWQMLYEGIEYFLDVTNLLEWCLYIFAIIFVINIDDNDVDSCQNEEKNAECWAAPASRRTVRHFRQFQHTVFSENKTDSFTGIIYFLILPRRL